MLEIIFFYSIPKVALLKVRLTAQFVIQYLYSHLVETAGQFLSCFKVFETAIRNGIVEKSQGFTETIHI